MRRAPDDPAFNKAVRQEVDGSKPSEKVLFIDTENRIREAVYPSEFHTGHLQKTRKRLESTGDLKAVVHLSATVFGAPDGPGPRTSVVEYLPTGEYCAFTTEPAMFRWVSLRADTADITKQLFGKEE